MVFSDVLFSYRVHEKPMSGQEPFSGNWITALCSPSERQLFALTLKRKPTLWRLALVVFPAASHGVVGDAVHALAGVFTYQYRIGGDRLGQHPRQHFHKEANLDPGARLLQKI